MNHTPGPWTLKSIRGGGWELSAGCVVLADAWATDGHGVPPSEAEANANLISSAPDLLAACKAALSFGEGHPERTAGWHDLRLDTQVALRAAIAKAEGAK